MFKYISDEFFKPLAYPYRDIYWECIKILFERAGLTFSIERTILLEELKEYFDNPFSLELIGSVESPEILGRSSTEKASNILRHLQEYGWIEVETNKSYIQFINFTEPAIKIFQTIQDIESGREVEYSGRILKIYSMATVQGNNEPDIVLEQMFEETRLLVTELQALNANIKKYIDELSKYKTTKELLEVLLNDYGENIINKAYHRLKTSENISKVRPIIIEVLSKRSKNTRYLNKVKEGLANRKEISIEEAYDLAADYLYFIIDKLKNLDEIIFDIDKKNSSYVTSAINRSKFLMMDSGDVQGQLRDILSDLNEKINEYDLNLKKIYEFEYLDNLIKIYSSLFPDEKSMYQLPTASKQFKPSSFKIEEMDEEKILEKEKKLLEKIQNQLTQNKINEYVLSILGSRNKINLSEFPLKTTTDFIKLIYIRLYNSRRKMKYHLNEISQNKTVSINGFSFKDCVVIKNV